MRRVGQRLDRGGHIAGVERHPSCSTYRGRVVVVPGSLLDTRQAGKDPSLGGLVSIGAVEQVECAAEVGRRPTPRSQWPPWGHRPPQPRPSAGPAGVAPRRYDPRAARCRRSARPVRAPRRRPCPRPPRASPPACAAGRPAPPTGRGPVPRRCRGRSPPPTPPASARPSYTPPSGTTHSMPSVTTSSLGLWMASW